MTYIVLGGALNSTHSVTSPSGAAKCYFCCSYVASSLAFYLLQWQHLKKQMYSENTIEQDSKANYIALTAAMKT